MAKLNIDPISSALEAGASAVEKVAGVFTTNAEKEAQRSADEQMALLKAYQAEFSQRENRNWIDSFADAFNRLVRPFIVSIIVFIFILAYISPEHFAKITLALSSVPNGYWALLSVIIGFYFGGRMQLKSQDFQFRQSQAHAVKALIETKKEFRKLEMDTDEPDREIGDEIAKSQTVNQERGSQMNEIIDNFLSTPEEEKQNKLKSLVKKLKNESDENTRSRRRLGPRRLR